jgi:hypothetical protein
MSEDPQAFFDLPAAGGGEDRAELEHDPEKCEAVFPRDKRERVCAEIMLKQRPKAR